MKFMNKIILLKLKRAFNAYKINNKEIIHVGEKYFYIVHKTINGNGYVEKKRITLSEIKKIELIPKCFKMKDFVQEICYYEFKEKKNIKDIEKARIVIYYYLNTPYLRHDILKNLEVLPNNSGLDMGSQLQTIGYYKNRKMTDREIRYALDNSEIGRKNVLKYQKIPRDIIEEYFFVLSSNLLHTYQKLDEDIIIKKYNEYYSPDYDNYHKSYNWEYIFMDQKLTMNFLKETNILENTNPCYIGYTGSFLAYAKLSDEVFDFLITNRNNFERINQFDLIYNISCNKYISEDFIIKNKDTLCLSYIFKNKQLSENILNKMIEENNLVTSHWRNIIKYQKVSEDFIIRNEKNIPECVFYGIPEEIEGLSEDFIDMYRNKINWHDICEKQNISKDFILSHLNYIDFKALKKSKFLTIEKIELIKEHEVIIPIDILENKYTPKKVKLEAYNLFLDLYNYGLLELYGFERDKIFKYLMEEYND